MDIGVAFTIGLTLLLLVSLVGPLVSRHIKEKKLAKLTCSSCGEASSIVITQNRLGHIWFGDTSVESGNLNTALIAMNETPFEDWIIGKQDKYSCCRKCGYFERPK